MEKEKRTIISSAIFMVFGLFMLAYAIPTQIAVGSILGSTSSVDSRWFPKVVSICILLISSIDLGFAVIKFVNQKKVGKVEGEVKVKEVQKSFRLKGEAKALTVFALFLAYSLAFDFVGFIPATIVIPAIVLFVMGGRKIRYYLSFYAVAAITYVLFVYVLGITIR